MLNLPDAPTVSQIFTAVGRSWQWDGTKWIVSGSSAPTMITVNNSTQGVLSAGFNGTVRVENNTSAPMTVTLPSTAQFATQAITIKDTFGNATDYDITIAGGGKTIEGATTLVISFNFGWAILLYTGVQWVQT